jgi:hypothetical protein
VARDACSRGPFMQDVQKRRQAPEDVIQGARALVPYGPAEEMVEIFALHEPRRNPCTWATAPSGIS